MPTLVDEMDALLSRAREGDNDAAGSLLTSQEEAVRCLVSARFDRRLAARLDVEDVIQDVWVVVVRRLPRYKKDPGMPFPDWVQHVTLDCLARCRRVHLRAKKRSVFAEGRRNLCRHGPDCKSFITSVEFHGEGPGCNCDRHELCECVGKLVKSLPHSDQELLRMRVLQGVPVRDVAMSLRMTVATVRLRLFRTLRWLRQCLEDERPRDG
jgi:RNA polymerase sigma-70 factor (ECF subfamily)